MGRSCYVIKNKEGGVDNVLAPNDQPSGLYQRAMEVLGELLAEPSPAAWQDVADRLADGRWGRASAGA